jgi:hypothetical protein
MTNSTDNANAEVPSLDGPVQNLDHHLRSARSLVIALTGAAVYSRTFLRVPINASEALG